MIISMYYSLDKGLFLTVEIWLSQLFEVYNNFSVFVKLSHFA